MEDFGGRIGVGESGKGDDDSKKGEDVHKEHGADEPGKRPAGEGVDNKADEPGDPHQEGCLPFFGSVVGVEEAMEALDHEGERRGGPEADPAAECYPAGEIRENLLHRRWCQH